MFFTPRRKSKQTKANPTAVASAKENTPLA